MYHLKITSPRHQHLRYVALPDFWTHPEFAQPEASGQATVASRHPDGRAFVRRGRNCDNGNIQDVPTRYGQLFQPELC